MNENSRVVNAHLAKSGTETPGRMAGWAAILFECLRHFPQQLPDVQLLRADFLAAAAVDTVRGLSVSGAGDDVVVIVFGVAVVVEHEVVVQLEEIRNQELLH